MAVVIPGAGPGARSDSASGAEIVRGSVRLGRTVDSS